MDKAEYFEQTIGPIKLVLSLECSSATLIQRLLPRGRDDDNLESIQKRIRTYEKDTLQVIRHFEDRGIVKHVDAGRSIEVVSEELQAVFTTITEGVVDGGASRMA
jgi:adenylate kinase family enzyme